MQYGILLAAAHIREFQRPVTLDSKMDIFWVGIRKKSLGVNSNLEARGLKFILAGRQWLIIFRQQKFFGGEGTYRIRKWSKSCSFQALRNTKSGISLQRKELELQNKDQWIGNLNSYCWKV
jgi:hypothetical protein